MSCALTLTASHRKISLHFPVQARLAQRRAKTGEDFNVLLVRFCLERLLYRLSRSVHREQFVLKGAMLFALWEPTLHRVTRDTGFTRVLANQHRRGRLPSFVNFAGRRLRAMELNLMPTASRLRIFARRKNMPGFASN